MSEEDYEAAETKLDAARDRANDAQRHIYDTDHLKWETEQEWLKAQNSGDREESERAWEAYQKAEKNWQEALDDKAEADREVEKAQRKLDEARNA